MTADENHRGDGRRSAPPPDATAAARPVVRGAVRGHVARAIGVLRDRLAEPWTLTTLAEEVHLSRSQLVRAFYATVGASPMVYLRQMRLRQMARLLTSTDLSISDPARALALGRQV